MHSSHHGFGKRASQVAAGALPLLLLLLPGCSSKHSGPDTALQQYLTDWSKQDYKGMYQLLSADAQSKITERAFENRYKAITSGVGLTQLQEKFQLPKDFKAQGDTASLSFHATWNTSIVGAVDEPYEVNLSKDKDGWKIDWTPALIFPGLKDGWKVRVTTAPAARGEIVDRNGIPLAIDEPGYSVGLVPGKMKDSSAANLAKELNLSAADIQAELNQSWVQSDTFVPVKTLAQSTEAKMEPQLLAIPGVLIKPADRTVRVYPKGTLAAQTIGYVGAITAQDLTSDKIKQGYTTTDTIGKQGVEFADEKWLRGTSGGEIWLEDGSGNKQRVIAQRDAVRGDTVQLTLDCKVQQAIESSMSSQSGGAVALNPGTGAVLAMASLPSFDPNQLSAGVSAAQWKQLSGNSQTPLVNKAISAVPPGSSIKPIVTSIGLDTNALSPNTVFPQDPVKWQKDASWGSYEVTRVGHPGGNPNLQQALVWSDNVYFAQAGLKIGNDALISGLNKWGLGKPFPFDLSVTSGQISHDNTIAGDTQLADSSYGQGQMLVSPLQLASMYSAFLNSGDVLQPYLIASIRDANGNAVKQGNTQVLDKGVVSSNAATTIRDDLHQVVADPTGTAHGIADLSKWTVSGKTGTAQVQGGKTGSDWGWFTAWAGKSGASPQYLVSMVLANVQNEEESHTTVHCVRAALQQLSPE